MTEKQQHVVMSSPALAERSDLFPEYWRGQVPFRVGMLRTVRSDLPLIIANTNVAYADEVYPVYVNSHGAVAAVFEDGSKLGLKPLEFVVVEFHASTER